MRYASILFFFALCGLFSCSLIDRPEPAPGYVMIRPPKVELDSLTGFTSQTGIRNVWFYHGGFLQGVYRIQPDTPIVFPIADLTRTDFFMEGGVYESGQSVFHIPYPFWNRISFNTQLTALDTLVLEPTFEYVEPRFYDFRVNEGFEGGAVDFVPFSLGLTEPDSTFIRLRSDDVFQGTGSGYVTFGPDDRYFQAVNSSPFSLTRGEEVFAEITYKNSMPFTVGLLYQNSSGLGSAEVLTVTPTGQWNTVYVHFVEEVRDVIGLGGVNTQFWLWLKADGEGKTGYIAFDDMRVITTK